MDPAVVLVGKRDSTIQRNLDELLKMQKQLPGKTKICKYKAKPNFVCFTKEMKLVKFESYPTMELEVILDIGKTYDFSELDYRRAEVIGSN